MQLLGRQLAAVRALEANLGNPYGEGLFSFARRVAEDEDERYPLEALHWLDAWGMQRHYVPASLGGSLENFELLFLLVRTISRRDLTLAITHAVSFLGSAAVWIAGSRTLQQNLASCLLGGQRISLALTEREHGGDLLSCEMKAEPGENAHCLTGEKWLINGATQNPLVSVLARTSQNGGPRGFSLFIFDKQAASCGEFTCLPKVRTLGVRGADISGIRLQNAALKSTAMVGAAGEGFETVIKGLYLTRLMCGAISLGAAETSFQVTLDFALMRRIHGGKVFDIPQCRRQLVQCWADLLLCEALLSAAARSLHFCPSEAAVHSAVVKYLVPRILEDTLKQLSVVLGARYYLREGLHYGIFQKMLRDSSLISLFDGSSVVNLYTLTTQFQALFRSWREGPDCSTQCNAFRLCDLTAPLPEFTWNGLSLVSGGRNCFSAALRFAITEARAIANSHCLANHVAVDLKQQVDFLESAVARVMAEIGSINFGAPHTVRPDAFDYASEYCLIAGAAMALEVWLANRRHANEDFSSGQWLVVALRRLNTCLGQKSCVSDNLMKDLTDQLLQNQADRPGFWTEALENDHLVRPATEFVCEHLSI